MKYFDTLPGVTMQDVAGFKNVVATNLLSRVSVIASILTDPLLYYKYDIQDGDTPESIATKYYGDPYRYWIVLFANQILDPLWDWPMDYKKFQAYIIDKYSNRGEESGDQLLLESGFNILLEDGSFLLQDFPPDSFLTLEDGFNILMEDGTFIALEDSTSSQSTASLDPLLYAKTAIYQYRKIITITETDTQTVTSNNFVITEEEYNALVPSLNTYTFPNKTQSIVEISKQAVSFYDWEDEVNEAKRSINLINSVYVGKLEQQFADLLTT